METIYILSYWSKATGRKIISRAYLDKELAIKDCEELNKVKKVTGRTYEVDITVLCKY